MSIKTQGQATPLQYACLYGLRSVADFYLSECHVPVDAISPCSETGWTALDILVANQRQDEARILSMVKWLVEEKGASVMPTDVTVNSPAILALIAGNLKVFQYLLEREMMERKAQQMEEDEKRKEAEFARCTAQAP